MPNALNVSKQKIEIEFDEIVQLKDQSTKVVISPVQKENPVVRAQGRKITIEFRDSLKPNTTYAIDFSDAIQDNNEGNPLEDFTFAFSTGKTIDSLRVSGIVLNARDLEPAQGVIVGIHSNLNDSAFTKMPLERISRTNELGQFTLKNFKPGSYHIFALKDDDRNYKFARSEDLAFSKDIIIPSTTEIITSDTIFTSKHYVDTVFHDVKHVRYLPNDIFLSMFNEDYKSSYLVDHKRLDARRLSVIFSAPSDTVPTLEILSPKNHAKDWYLLEKSVHNDTLTYWMKDTNLINSDSIKINMRYLHTDSLDNLTFTNDTVFFNYKKPKKSKKELKKEEEDAKLLQESKNAKDSAEHTPKTPLIKITQKNTGVVEVYDPLRFSIDEPLDSINKKGIHLELKRDSLWDDVGPVKFVNDTAGGLLQYKLDYDWKPGESYRVTVDSLALHSIYGLFNGPLKNEFKIRTLEEYANLFFKVNVNDSAFVELLTAGDKVARTAPVVNGNAEFFNINPGDYYARIVLDRNGNGKWDTGNYKDSLQPEEVYYFPKKIVLKKYWDVNQPWNIFDTPVDLQKPNAIKKNKPKDKKNQEKEKTEDTEEEENFNTNFYTGNKYQDFRNNNKTNRTNNY